MYRTSYGRPIFGCYRHSSRSANYLPFYKAIMVFFFSLFFLCLFVAALWAGDKYFNKSGGNFRWPDTFIRHRLNFFGLPWFFFFLLLCCQHFGIAGDTYLKIPLGNLRRSRTPPTASCPTIFFYFAASELVIPSYLV